ncbi:MAG: Argininosuccinate lyase [Chloroflexi bacterium AL-W]|nr:Argininosuccinate lyase [Chloroflexi bacterium AL-N1]NOK67144.1 Argininosuccinate lyase [Chloroflexi bacterium AL-N10]NOK74563.1 Argininosuccinate lyase [Chloroflexi bacterium AL-N5]NOK81746.1 Argininosuccinate lyase [Chloroflexi bacterium AL-W]NOK89216.1 Argininosuccinate lyase [Chloroflexi bacterium AL-N15]
MWGGRFSGTIDEHMARFNNSFAFDHRMWDEDIRGSMAWARQLAHAGILTPDELLAILRGLETVRAEFAKRHFVVHPSDEDIHTAVERRLTEIVGDVAGKLHTGRSRNDQVATDTRLWTLGALRRVECALRDVQNALLTQAEAAKTALMPGYTHLQRAQPVLTTHWLLSHFWRLERDHARLVECLERTSTLPLGSGALAGTSLDIDRSVLAKDLGFNAISFNSLDAVSDRDFIVEWLFCAAMIGVHLSQLAEDLIIYSSTEFGFVTLDEAFATGSSLMPQKKNPDSLELTRGKAGRLIGNLVTLLTLLKGLPSTYNKDLQEDKEPLFDAVDTLELTLPVVAGVIRTSRFHYNRMREALDDGMLATDVADYLVEHGVPFREAHRVVGVLVSEAETRQVQLSKLSLEVYRAVHPAFDDDIYMVFNLDRSAAARRVPGATSAEAVQEQLKQARACLRET